MSLESSRTVSLIRARQARDLRVPPRHRSRSTGQRRRAETATASDRPAPEFRRAFVASRGGYDHSWIGVLLFTALLTAGGLTPVRADEPFDHWTAVSVPATAMPMASEVGRKDHNAPAPIANPSARAGVGSGDTAGIPGFALIEVYEIE